MTQDKLAVYLHVARAFKAVAYSENCCGGPDDQEDSQVASASVNVTGGVP